MFYEVTPDQPEFDQDYFQKLDLEGKVGMLKELVKEVVNSAYVSYVGTGMRNDADTKMIEYMTVLADKKGVLIDY